VVVVVELTHRAACAAAPELKPASRPRPHTSTRSMDGSVRIR
jgi:hypothetical protein